jgi:aminotransferase
MPADKLSSLIDKSAPAIRGVETGVNVSRHVTRTITDLDLVGSRVIEPRIESMRLRGRTVIPVHGYAIVDHPEHITSAVVEAMRCPTPSSSRGILKLRESIARSIGEVYGGAPDPQSEVLITCGAMHALRIVLSVLLGSGDEAIIVTPCYFFGGIIELAGGRVVRVATDPSDGYLIDFDKLRTAITPRTKLIVVSSPVNPTGYVYTRSDVAQFVALAEEFDLLLVSDESYDRMIFDGREHISPFHIDGARTRTVLIKSFTKSYALPAWRVGYIVADADLMPYFLKAFEWDLLYSPHINQHAALAALDGPQDWLVKIFREIEQRRDALIEGLKMSDYRWVRPQGGPFLFLKVCDADDGDESIISERLLDRYGVPNVPGRCFGAPGYVRVPYAGDAEAVRNLVSRLVEARCAGL